MPLATELDRPATDVGTAPVLMEIDGLRTHFFTRDGIVQAVDGVSFDVRRGETVGIVGESGSGKSVTALSIMQLLPKGTGRIVDGRVRLGIVLLDSRVRGPSQVRDLTDTPQLVHETDDPLMPVRHGRDRWVQVARPLPDLSNHTLVPVTGPARALLQPLPDRLQVPPWNGCPEGPHLAGLLRGSPVDEVAVAHILEISPD